MRFIKAKLVGALAALAMLPSLAFAADTPIALLHCKVMMLLPILLTASR